VAPVLVYFFHLYAQRLVFFFPVWARTPLFLCSSHHVLLQPLSTATPYVRRDFFPPLDPEVETPHLSTLFFSPCGFLVQPRLLRFAMCAPFGFHVLPYIPPPPPFDSTFVWNSPWVCLGSPPLLPTLTPGSPWSPFRFFPLQEDPLPSFFLRIDTPPPASRPFFLVARGLPTPNLCSC